MAKKELSKEELLEKLDKMQAEMDLGMDTDTDLDTDLDMDLDYIDEDEDEDDMPTEWTIITALNYVLKEAEGSQLSKRFWKKAEKALAFLREKTGLTNMQIVFVAMLVESGEAMAWRDFGKYLNCTRISMMVYTDELENLLEKRWISRRPANHFGTNWEGFGLERGVVTALRHNKTFVPEKIDGLTIQQFMERLESHLDKNLNRRDSNFEDEQRWMVTICKANPHLPICQEALRYEDDINVLSLLLMIAFDYAQWADSDDEGLTMDTINMLFDEEYESNNMRMHLRNGNHVLMRNGYIEHKCENGIADTERYMLTRKTKEELLSGYKPTRTKCIKGRRNQRVLMKHEGIKAKEMYYNATEQEQIDRLSHLLEQKNFEDVQSRLEKEGMRKGFACLFYGAPGTGKTETVLQIARQTGRDIMQVDIAGMRDKFVGESEKNIKAIFARYKEVCKQSKIMPILFFNEADGIFGKRTTFGGINPSVEKMDNAMQNIILQEMENLEGILIATTNLTCNLDSAFERRFLFKVEFHKPDIAVKAKLWCSMLGDCITEEDAKKLAIRYDFSGGQIENIARKRTIEFILSGQQATFEELDKFCQSELMEKSIARRPIGFAC